MPMYVYKCKECNEKFEELVSSEDQIVKCTKCGSESVEKQLTGFAIGSDNSGTCSTGTCCPTCNL